MNTSACKATLAGLMAAACVSAAAQDAGPDAAAELTKKLASPVAALISVPPQYNYDEYGGANDGASVDRRNLQPVVPISISQDWNLITRTILPLVDQQGIPVECHERVGPGRRAGEPVLLAQAADGQRMDLGRGPSIAIPQDRLAEITERQPARTPNDGPAPPCGGGAARWPAGILPETHGAPMKRPTPRRSCERRRGACA
ncbi:MAG: hypothetical protein U1F09_03080 [Steroidobacteraceae bacterium]